MSKVKANKKVKVRLARLAFANLFAMDSYQRFSTDLLVPVGSEADKEIRAAVNEVATKAWGANAGAQLKKFMNSGDLCYKDGATKTDRDGNPWTGYEGNWALTATSKVQPLLLDENRNEIGETSGKLYSGAYVVAMVEVWAQTGPKYYGVRCQLQGVQHVKDAESFGGGRRASMDDFEDAPDGDPGDAFATGNDAFGADDNSLL